MYISDLKPLGKDRVIVCVDDEAVFALYKKEAEAFSLAKDEELGDEAYAEILKLLMLRAKRRAMNILQRQDKTVRELTLMLEKSYYPSEAVEAAIEYVSSYGYLDDARYARAYIEYRQDKKSKRQLESELIARGVDRQLLSDILEEMFDGDESAAIRKVVEKRLGGPLPDCLPDEGDEKGWARLYRFLLGRGYSYADIRRALGN